MVTVSMANGTVFADIESTYKLSGTKCFLGRKFYCGHPAKCSRLNSCQIPLLGTNAVCVFIVFGAAWLTLPVAVWNFIKLKKGGSQWNSD